MKKLSNIEILGLCSKTKAERHAYIFAEVFGSFADDCVKYNHVENGDITREYIMSGIYTKFLELCDKIAERENVPLDCAYTDATACRWAICLIKKVTTSLNFTPCGEYVKKSGYGLEGFKMAVSHGGVTREYDIPTVYVADSVELVKGPSKSIKKVDVVDVLKQWENRATRSATRKEQQFTMYTDEEGHTASEETRLKGNYRTPEEELIYNCNMELVRREVSKIATTDRDFMRVYNALITEEVLTENERQILSRFRKRNGLEGFTISDLRELFA